MTAPDAAVSGRKWRVGIVGAGKIATDMHIPVLCTMSDVEISWILDSDRARASSIANAFGTKGIGHITEATPVDIALLAIPIPPRAEYFEHFAAHGTAVFAEKPLAVSAADHSALMVKFEDWQLSVGFQRRSYASSEFLRRVLQDEIFGKPERIRIREGSRTTKTGEYGQFQDLPVSEGGGISTNLGCHSLDLAIFLFGASRYEIVEKSIAWDEDTDRRARASIILDRPGDAPGKCLLDWEVSWIDHEPNTMEIVLPSAIVVAPISPTASVKLLSLDRQLIATIDVMGRSGAVSIEQAFYLEWRSALAALATRTASPFSASSALLTAQLVDDLLAE